MVVRRQELEVEIDVDHLDRNALEQGQRVVAEMASPAREELHGASIVAGMRPFTTIVIIGLVVLIVGAFVVKLATTGLTP